VCDDDGAGERDSWAFDVADLSFFSLLATGDSSPAVGPCVEVDWIHVIALPGVVIEHAANS